MQTHILERANRYTRRHLLCLLKSLKLRLRLRITGTLIRMRLENSLFELGADLLLLQTLLFLPNTYVLLHIWLEMGWRCDRSILRWKKDRNRALRSNPGLGFGYTLLSNDSHSSLLRFHTLGSFSLWQGMFGHGCAHRDNVSSLRLAACTPVCDWSMICSFSPPFLRRWERSQFSFSFLPAFSSSWALPF